MVRGRGRKYKMGRRGIRGLKMRVGRERSISRERPDFTVEVYMSEKAEEGVTVLRKRGGAAPRVRVAKSSEFGEGKV